MSYIVVWVDDSASLYNCAFAIESEALAFIESMEWKAFLLQGKFLGDYT